MSKKLFADVLNERTIIDLTGEMLNNEKINNSKPKRKFNSVLFKIIPAAAVIILIIGCINILPVLLNNEDIIPPGMEMTKIDLELGAYFNDSDISYLILQENNKFTFIRNIMMSYAPSGDYVIKDKKLFLYENFTGKYMAEFEIKDGQLIYQGGGSAEIDDYIKKGDVLKLKSEEEVLNNQQNFYVPEEETLIDFIVAAKFYKYSDTPFTDNENSYNRIINSVEDDPDGGLFNPDVYDDEYFKNHALVAVFFDYETMSIPKDIYAVKRMGNEMMIWVRDFEDINSPENKDVMSAYRRTAKVFLIEVNKSDIKGIDEIIPGFDYAPVVILPPETTENPESYTDTSAEQYQGLSETNPDFLCWLKVGFTSIDYPVVQTTDNEYYLAHDFNKKYSRFGSIFADYQNSKNITDNRNFILYGHNMLDNTMFQPLIAAYEKNENNFKNGMIEIYTPEEVYYYEIFSVSEEEPTSGYNQTSFNSDEEYVEFLQSLKDRSIFQKNIVLNADSKIITLSTWINDVSRDMRFVVRGVLVDKNNYGSDYPPVAPVIPDEPAPPFEMPDGRGMYLVCSVENNVPYQYSTILVLNPNNKTFSLNCNMYEGFSINNGTYEAANFSIKFTRYNKYAIGGAEFTLERTSEGDVTTYTYRGERYGMLTDGCIFKVITKQEYLEIEQAHYDFNNPNSVDTGINSIFMNEIPMFIKYNFGYSWFENKTELTPSEINPTFVLYKTYQFEKTLGNTFELDQNGWHYLLPDTTVREVLKSICDVDPYSIDFSPMVKNAPNYDPDYILFSNEISPSTCEFEIITDSFIHEGNTIKFDVQFYALLGNDAGITGEALYKFRYEFEPAMYKDLILCYKFIKAVRVE